MKIKFVAPDLSKFTGMYGQIEFLDGLSVNDVTHYEVQLYGAITSIEVVGKDYNPDEPYDVVKYRVAESANLPTLADLQELEEPETTGELVKPEGLILYTEKQLEVVADQEGIAGIRAIAEKLSLRGTSISKLIKAILVAQAPFVADAGFIEAPKDAVTLTMTDPLSGETTQAIDPIHTEMTGDEGTDIKLQ